MKPIPFLKMPKSRAKFLLAVCTEIYGRRPFTLDEAMNVYFQAVGCEDEGAVVNALCSWLKDGRSFPTPADLRLLIEFSPAQGQASTT
ncbi:hypothetical protein [Ottowia sp. VDI28]|uniref:hypothetical protein n=1 Tax=Ottowia sp. VDI28 TaxID=3133968 RepID=UPI003C2C999C